MLQEIRNHVTELLGPQFADWLAQAYWLVVAPLFAQPTLHLLFIASTIIAAGIFFAIKGARGAGSSDAEAGRGFFAWLLPKRIYTHPSAIIDFKFYVVNQFVMTYLRLGQFVTGLVAVLYVANGVTWIAGRALGESAATGGPPALVALAFSLLMALAFDFGRFLSHFVQHRSAILWEFHKVHHSAAVLTPISSYRAHPVDQMIEFLFRLTATSIIGGAFAWYYPQGIKELTILNYGVVTFFFYLTSHLRHSHVPMSFGALDRTFISPYMHQLHHSASPEHFDRNFGFVFAWWDRLFGTLYVPRADERFDLGLPANAGKYDTATALFLHPFRAAARIVVASLSRRQQRVA